MGYKLHRKGGLYCITDLEVGGIIHSHGFYPHCLDLDDVREWAVELAS